MRPVAPTPAAADHTAAADLRLSRRELALIAAFWTLFALLTVANRLVGAGESDPRAAMLAGPLTVAFSESLCWAVATPAVFWLAGRGDAEAEGGGSGLSRGMRVALFVLLGAVVAAGITLLGHELRQAVGVGGPGGRGGRGGGFGGPPPGRDGGARFDPLDPFGPPLGRGQRMRGGPPRPSGPPWFAFANAFLTYLGVYAAGLARAFSLRYRARREQAARLQAQLAEARLDALRRQLDPHFLFNTLNAVSALVERDPRGVRRMIARLSDLLRHSIEGPAEPEVPLRDELALLARYVEIMQVRFQGRLVVETHADPRALDALVPSMVLQPLVENAIKHGVERITEEGRIAIDASVEGDAVVLRVADNGPGPQKGEPAAEAPGRPAGSGVGLRNTVARLAEIHGDAARFTLAPGDAGGAVAEVRLPYRAR